MALRHYIHNIIAIANLLCGALGIIYAMQGRMMMAFIFMMMAVCLDLCADLAAKLLKADSPVGKELDSLCDMVSFGLLLECEIPIFRMNVSNIRELRDVRRIVFMTVAGAILVVTIITDAHFCVAVLLINCFFILENLFLWAEKRRLGPR